jgi:O-acetyl-ADP-ribose deacetylase (regulator of RNase III)
MGGIGIIVGDITGLEVDAIVNAANPGLLGGGGVDGAIHRAAGPQLREYNRGLGGCNPGEARISPGFRLPARWVISTVGPVWHGGTQGEPNTLKRCYESCFELARQTGLRSIAFPAISTGVYGYPREAAAVIALASMRAAAGDFDSVLACCFSPEDAEVYARLCPDCARDSESVPRQPPRPRSD